MQEYIIGFLILTTQKGSYSKSGNFLVLFVLYGTYNNQETNYTDMLQVFFFFISMFSLFPFFRMSDQYFFLCDFFFVIVIKVQCLL